MVLPGKGLTSDQIIEFTDALTAKKCPILLRRIGYRDPETDKHYIFLTNNSLLLPVTVASFTSRGFLPRGLSDACPLSSRDAWQACGWGQASYNP